MNGIATKILEATATLLLRGGAGKATMDGIAANARVSKVTVYKYFKDKDTLYLEMARRILSACAGRLESAALGEAPLARRFCGFMDVMADFAASGRHALCLELAACNPGLEGELERFRQAYGRVLYELIDGGLAAGMMKPGLDREILFHYIDMGVACFRQDAAYRERMLLDGGFRRRLMSFFIGNVFADPAVLSLPDR